MSKDKRFARKEVRQFAKWLERKGWVADGLSNAGHALYFWPPTSKTIELPHTPGTGSWKTRLRTEACHAMGLDPHAERPNHRRSKKPVQTSGFNLGAAIKESRRSREADQFVFLHNADLHAAYENEVDHLRDLAAHPSPRSAAEGRDCLTKIRQMEDSLRGRGIFVPPFDIDDIKERSPR